MVKEDIGTEAKECLDYWFAKHVEECGFKPIVCGKRDMEIFKRILRVYDAEAVREVTDFFFSYKKRSDFGTRALFNRFDTLYGVLKRLAEGR